MVHLTQDTFGSYNGEPVKKFTWKTSSMELTAISFGAVIQSIKMSDKNGVIEDVALGFDDLEGYVKRNQKYFGSVVGRCANRIRKANFDIDGVNYKLADNNNGNSLHGGILAFHLVNWQSTVDGNKVIFSYFSKDGEEGYPGDLVTNVIYEVTDDNVFSMTYTAATTKKTLVNLTNHSYFNLAGHEKGAEALYDHVIVVNADKVTEADVEQVTTGKLIDVGGTPFDLRTAIRLGDAMNRGPKLFDNNYCISTYGNKDLNFVSRVSHPPSGRTLEVYSNQPGVQVYTSNVLPTPDEPAVIGKDGVGYRRHGAFCLETQNYPDAIHHENFPKVVLTPGEIYDHKVQYRFGVDKECQPSVVLK